jgi:antirestriction protein ArdC
LAPIVSRQRHSAASSRTSYGEEPEANDGEQDETVVGFRPVRVFDVSQTAGAPLADLAIVAGNPSVYTDRLKAFVAEHGMVIEYSGRIAPARGACTGKTIVLVPDMPPGEHLSTLAHELGHALLHRRDEREGSSRTVRETEAEAVACVVCEAIGLESRSSSADYIQLWNGDVKTLAASLERVQHTASTIIAVIGPDV